MDSLRLPKWRKKRGGMTEDERVMVDTGYFAGHNSGMTVKVKRRDLRGSLDALSGKG